MSLFGDPRISARFWSKVEIHADTGCWDWTAALTNGYGVFHIPGGGGRNISSHRLVVQTFEGPIPEGMHVDHLCRNTRCCNPGHLEVVTPAENIYRGYSPMAENLRKTHCIRGHELVGANVYMQAGGKQRSCMECKRLRWPASRERRKIREAMAKKESK